MNENNFHYTTWELDELVSSIEKPANFLIRTFFPNVIQSEAPEIKFDIEEGGRQLAPFVSPLAPGRLVRSRGTAMGTLTPAYLKPKSFARPGDSFTRRPGEAIGGKLTARERMDRIIADHIANHIGQVDNRLEWMAAQALVNGYIDVEGEFYAAVRVNFGRHSDLVSTLGAGVKWSENNGVPLDDIEDMALKIRKRSYGAVVTDIVMDGGAWKYFRKKMEGNVNFAVMQRLGSSQLEVGPRVNVDGELVGTLSGRIRVWVYDGHYEDNDGVMQPFLPAYTCLLIATQGMEGKQYFGAIQDLDADMRAQKIFTKTHTHFDPSAVEVLSQSAPLVAPRRRNAFARITVHS